MAYDSLMKAHVTSVAAKNYLKILKLAARKSESAVDEALRIMINQGMKIDFETVEDLYESAMAMPLVKEVVIPQPDLSVYDELCQYATTAGVE